MFRFLAFLSNFLSSPLVLLSWIFLVGGRVLFGKPSKRFIAVGVSIAIFLVLCVYFLSVPLGPHMELR